jgi:hypothetical protein
VLYEIFASEGHISSKLNIYAGSIGPDAHFDVPLDAQIARSINSHHYHHIALALISNGSILAISTHNDGPLHSTTPR